jgi:hypothetical protein
VITTQKNRVVAADPALKRLKARTSFAGLYLADDRRLLASEAIHIHIGAIPFVPGGAGQGHSFAVDAEGEMKGDDLALKASAFSMMAGATRAAI